MSRIADFEIATLDQALADAGQDIVLRRIVGSTTQVNIDVTCRAFVRKYAVQPVAGTVTQGDTQVIISPTQINAAQWPGGTPSSILTPSVPRDSDKVIIAGAIRQIMAVAPVYIDNVLVRVDMQVRG